MKARLSGSETQPVAPATSEVPRAEPPTFCRAIVPHPEAASGGVENIPEELVAPGEQLHDELDHASLDQELPGEDRAPAAAGQAKLPEKWRAPSP